MPLASVEPGSRLIPAPDDLLARGARLQDALGREEPLSAATPSLAEARAAQQRGRPADAAAILRDLLRDPVRAGEGALGLAVLALGCEDLGDAGAFARFCLERGERSARACAVAGLAALEAGDAADAQRLLSAAARIARASPDAGDDLRGAQRVLLLMQLAAR